jgi:hypothetical protein
MALRIETVDRDRREPDRRHHHTYQVEATGKVLARVVCSTCRHTEITYLTDSRSISDWSHDDWELAVSFHREIALTAIPKARHVA